MKFVAIFAHIERRLSLKSIANISDSNQYQITHYSDFIDRDLILPITVLYLVNGCVSQ